MASFLPKMADNSLLGSFLILCGIPASGKTTFAKELIQRNWKILGKYVHFIYVNYDDFIQENMATDFTSILDGWKAKRKEILNGMEELIQSENSDNNVSEGRGNSTSNRKIFVSKACSCGGHMRRSTNIYHIVVIDDNMYYRSMRYEYYQLARKVQFAFVEINLYCPLEIALSRNADREDAVSMDTIIKMFSRIEKPEAEKFPWEKLSMMVDTSNYVSQEKWKEILELLQVACCTLPPPLKVLNEEEKAKDRSITKQNIIHQADQVIRKHISAKLSKIKEKSENTSKEELKQTAKKLNKLRRNVMEKIKKDPLRIADDVFSERYQLSCKTRNFEPETRVHLAPESLQNEQKSDEAVDKTHSELCDGRTATVSDETASNDSQTKCRDVDKLTSRDGFRWTFTVDHFWDVVSLEDFSNMVRKYFEEFHE